MMAKCKIIVDDLKRKIILDIEYKLLAGVFVAAEVLHIDDDAEVSKRCPCEFAVTRYLPI